MPTVLDTKQKLPPSTVIKDQDRAGRVLRVPDTDAGGQRRDLHTVAVVRAPRALLPGDVDGALAGSAPRTPISAALLVRTVLTCSLHCYPHDSPDPGRIPQGLD